MLGEWITVKELAMARGCSRQAIHDWLERHNIERQNILRHAICTQQGRLLGMG